MDDGDDCDELLGEVGGAETQTEKTVTEPHRDQCETPPEQTQSSQPNVAAPQPVATPPAPNVTGKKRCVVFYVFLGFPGALGPIPF